MYDEVRVGGRVHAVVMPPVGGRHMSRPHLRDPLILADDVSVTRGQEPFTAPLHPEVREESAHGLPREGGLAGRPIVSSPMLMTVSPWNKMVSTSRTKEA